MNGVKNGPHKLSRRDRAQRTRLRIVQSALSAFVERGYAATTMESVAADAGVAVQTVYFTFRSKGDLLQAAYEHVVLGPEHVAPHLSAWWRAVEAEPNVAAAICGLVEGTLDVLDRAAPLVWAVLGDVTAHEGYQRNEGLRRDGNMELVRILASKHPLLPGLSRERARDVLLLLTGPILYSQLTRDMGWGRAEVEQWVVATVGQQLFGIDTTR